MRILVGALAVVAVTVTAAVVSVPLDASAKGSRSVLGHTRKDGTYVPPRSESSAEVSTHPNHHAPSRHRTPNSGGSDGEENIGHLERLERGAGSGTHSKAAPEP